MKRYLLLLLMVQWAVAQDKTVFLDKFYRPVAEGEHVFYRVIKDYDKEQSSYQVRTFYVSGVLREDATVLSKDGMQYEGQVIRYFDNGQIEEINSYRLGKRAGMFKSWYPDGKKKMEAVYPADGDGVQRVIQKFWNASNEMTVVDGNGNYVSDDGVFFEEGQIRNGIKEGEWKGGFHQDGFTYVEEYAGGNLIKGVSTDTKGKTYPYDALELKPEFPGSAEEFYKYIGKSLKVPKKLDKEGRIILSFVVTPEGEVSEIKVVKGLDEKLDQEAIRVLSKSKKWKPAEQRGIPVRCSYMLPILIRKP